MQDTGERFIPSKELTVTGLEHWHRYMSILEYLENKKVLDIACGSGYGSFLMAEKAETVVGMDISTESIEYAKINYQKENLKYEIGSVTQIPIQEKEIFDIIISYETIEHINEEDQYKFLKEIKRLLKKDGILIISTPNKKTYTDLTKNKNPYHIKEFYLEEYLNFLKNYFQYIQILGQKVYSISFMWNIPQNKTSSEKVFYITYIFVSMNILYVKQFKNKLIY